MPLLGLRDRQHIWADGDDDRLCCPATLDRLSENEKMLALSILKQIERRNQLEFCLSLYSTKGAAKLQRLMFEERVRLIGLQRAIV